MKNSDPVCSGALFLGEGVAMRHNVLIQYAPYQISPQPNRKNPPANDLKVIPGLIVYSPAADL
jgi:hypothetical protein